MKQHDLLLLLCETHPNVFVITICFKEQIVTVDASRPKWSKEIPYKRYKDYSVEYLAKEILDEYDRKRLNQAAA